MRYRATLILFALSLALGGLYFFYIAPKIEAERLAADFESRFFRADASKIESLRIDVGEGPVDLSRAGDGWFIAGDRKIKADAGRIKRFFDTLSKGKIIKTVGEAEGLAAFGLDTPNIVIGVGMEGYLDILKIGDKTPSDTGFYAASERLNKVFVVDKDFVRDVYLRPIDLRDRRMFPMDAAAVTAIAVNSADYRLRLVRGQNGKWEMLEPDAGPASIADADELLDKLEHANAEVFEAWDGKSASDARASSRLEVVIEGAGGTDVYDVYYSGSKQLDAVLAHKRGADEAARTRREIWELLRLHPDTYMPRNLFSMQGQDVIEIELVYQDKRALLKRGDKGWLDASGAGADKAAGEIIEKVGALKAVRLLEKSPSNALSERQITIRSRGASETLEITDVNMDALISKSRFFVREVPGELKTVKIDYLYARSSALKRAVVVNSFEMDGVFKLAGLIDAEDKEGGK